MVFISCIAEERGEFEIGGVLDTLIEKLIRRHPHVFGDVCAETSGAGDKELGTIKVSERRTQRDSSVMQMISEGCLPFGLSSVYQNVRRSWLTGHKMIYSDAWIKLAVDVAN